MFANHCSNSRRARAAAFCFLPADRMIIAVGLTIGLSCTSDKKPATPDSGAVAVDKDSTGQEVPSDTTAKVTQVKHQLVAPKTSLAEHPAGQAWVFDDPEQPRALPLEQAESQGYTLIDLSDNWRPFVFSEKTPGVDDFKKNSYARRYVGLANDKLDGDGDKMQKYEHNYLELFGIPPSLSVVHNEWLAAETDLAQCLEAAGADPSVFTRYDGVLAFRPHLGPKRLAKHKRTKLALAKAMKRAKIAADDLEAAKNHPKVGSLARSFEELDAEIQVVKQAQIRFRCERLFPTNKGLGRFVPGVFDSHLHMALANFERKHNLMGWGHFTPANLSVLAAQPTQTTYDRFLRVIQERVVASAGIVEDGSAVEWKPKFAYKDASGNETGLRNLTQEFTQAAIRGLGLDTLELARAQLDRLEKLEATGFEKLVVGIKMPALPAYYASNMEFDVVIHRGDVWYDLPYAEDGSAMNQRRVYYPHLTLYTVYEGQKIPLVHWRTTIGSWRSEEHDGKEYLVYKNSDVGERVWKDIVSAPTWIPPEVTPTRTLVKWKFTRGSKHRVVNYDETGPGYGSAYGLVAAYHVKLTYDEEGNIVREWDNQIRTHGSADYMSIIKRFSHGCHRLYNMRALEMFSFILQHRDFTRQGRIPLGYRRQFSFEGKEFSMELDSRGYRFELTSPIHVNVLEGRIRGRRKSPYSESIPKPGVIYDEEGINDEGEGQDGEDSPPDATADSTATPTPQMQ